jgi:multiple sugar transport system permease protein
MLFFFFFLGPIIVVFLLSLTDYNILILKYIGLENFHKMLSDLRFWKILLNTFKYVLIFVPAHMILGLFFALCINRKISNKLKYFYRTALYFPVLVTTSAVSIVWVYIYDTNFGMLNYYLETLFNIEPIAWLYSSKYVYISITIFGIWKFIGQPTIYYLVGLQSVPASILEAADIDGVNFFQKLFIIIIPMISPTIFFVAVTVMINTVQIFEAPYILTAGGPGDASRSLNLMIYESAYRENMFGYASALSLILFLIILMLTVGFFSIGRKYVYYETE